jgi:hypothetical protein
MRGALVHGALLAVMLVYGYKTWTRDKTAEPTTGNVVLWDKTEADLVSIEYKAPKKIVKLERKPEGYWWGVDTTIETKPKAVPPKPADAGSGSGSAGSGSAGSGSAGSGSAGSGSAAPPPPVEEEEVGRKAHEFPLGDAADKLIKTYAAARALRDLGAPSTENKKDYKLDEAKTTITVTFKDGARTFLVGGSVYGGSDKYAVDKASGKAYVLSKDLISALEIGETSLHLVDPRGFEATKIDSVTIEAGGKTKTVARIQTGVEGQQVKTWGDPDTKKANQTFANFVDNTNNLKPTEYATTLKASDLAPVLKLTYKDDHGILLGTLTLYKHEKPGQLGPDQELDPANPPKGELEYYIMTEKTRVPALVRKDTAQRTEQDIEDVFSGKEPPPGAGSGHSIDPKGNPFGNGPLPPTGPGPGGMPPHGPGGPPPGGPGAMPPGGPGAMPPGGMPPHGPPAAGSAAPAAGSAAGKPGAPNPDLKAPTPGPAPAPKPPGAGSAAPAPKPPAPPVPAGSAAH